MRYVLSLRDSVFIPIFGAMSQSARGFKWSAKVRSEGNNTSM